MRSTAPEARKVSASIVCSACGVSKRLKSPWYACRVAVIVNVSGCTAGLGCCAIAGTANSVAVQSIGTARVWFFFME
ncbi:MAG: hypothetical protein ACK5VR_00235 [Burkholderiales bacterium]